MKDEKKMFRFGVYSINKNQIQFIRVLNNFDDIRNWNGIEIFFSNNKITIKTETKNELEELENILINEGLL